MSCPNIIGCESYLTICVSVNDVNKRHVPEPRSDPSLVKRSWKVTGHLWLNRGANFPDKSSCHMMTTTSLHFYTTLSTRPSMMTDDHPSFIISAGSGYRCTVCCKPITNIPVFSFTHYEEFVKTVPEILEKLHVESEAQNVNSQLSRHY